jgi:hypothetical protein
MSMAVLLWVVGAALLAVGLWRVRAPLARYRGLQATQANLARYDDWRGSRLRPDPGERTGADVMLDLLRRQVLLWGGTAVIGAVLVLGGFLAR